MAQSERTMKVQLIAGLIASSLLGLMTSPASASPPVCDINNGGHPNCISVQQRGYGQPIRRPFAVPFSPHRPRRIIYGGKPWYDHRPGLEGYGRSRVVEHSIVHGTVTVLEPHPFHRVVHIPAQPDADLEWFCGIGNCP